MSDEEAGDCDRAQDQGHYHEDVNRTEMDVVFIVDWAKGGPKPAASIGVNFKTCALHESPLATDGPCDFF
jgi:hypothetical protein